MYYAAVAVVVAVAAVVAAVAVVVAVCQVYLEHHSVEGSRGSCCVAVCC